MSDNVPGPLMNASNRMTLKRHAGRFGDNCQNDDRANLLLRGSLHEGARMITIRCDLYGDLCLSVVEHIVLFRGPKSEEDPTTVDQGVQFIGWEHGPRSPSGWRVAYRFVSDFASETFTVDRIDVAPDSLAGNAEIASVPPA